MDTHAITTIARQELVINIRNRWTIVFAGVFGVLVLAISYFGLVTGGAVGFQGFARTSASLLNMVLYIIPLVALTMGTLSFTSEKSASELLYPAFIGFSLLLALIFLSLSTFISAVCRRKTKAFGVALFVWFFFVLFYDLIVIGATFLFKERTANAFIFGSLFGNPVDMVRVASLMTLNGKDIFGAGGAALLRFLGG